VSVSRQAKVLWKPGSERLARATITHFARHVGHPGSYDELWRWSVGDIEGFWRLLAADGYRYGGADFDCAGKVAAIAAEVGVSVVRLGYLDGSGWQDSFLGPAEPREFERLPFEHPLWVLYSSGTTGLPKPIVHGHGGILLEQLKHHHLHLDAQAGGRHEVDRLGCGELRRHHEIALVLAIAGVGDHDHLPRRRRGGCVLDQRVERAHAANSRAAANWTT
jgi:acyl-CoA synthetase (AMP-forming)/AMP-acid ligase II